MPEDTQSHTTEMDRNIVLAVVFFAYIIFAKVGLSLYSVNTFATLVWPPSGIALAAYLLFGFRIWPAVFFAAFLVNSSIGANTMVALGIALGNTVGPLAGAYIVKWYSGYRPSSMSIRDSVGIVASAFVVPIITATIGVQTLLFAGKILPHTLANTWTTWWVGDALGILIFAPFILKWFTRPFFERTQAQKFELFTVVVVVTLISCVIFWIPLTQFTYVMFIPFTYAALRTGPRGVTIASLFSSTVAMAGTLFGNHPIDSVNLLYLQIFLGSVVGTFFIFAAAVEERRNALEMLKQHVNKLESALHKISSEDEAKREFLAILAHELRNPLATILSSIELMHLQGRNATNSGTLLETIDERSRAMVRLLDDLLDITRISQKKMQLHKEVLSVDHFVDKLVTHVQPIIRKYGHSLSVTKRDLDMFVEADPIRLEQIFTNLVANASKYTDAPGKIELKVEREGNMATMHLLDTGVGIPKNMLQRIFEPFFQIHRTQPMSDKQGIGVGLPLTRQLVEMHGGTIEAKSAGANSGSEFIVKLPLSVRTPARPAAVAVTLNEKDRSVRKVKNTYKILIVDDNESATKVLGRMLELRGHSIAVAYDGGSAVDKALEFEPDVIILDIGLPDMDGYQVARILKEHKKPYFLIALTGYGQDEDKEKAERAGFEYHLTKPAGLKEIEAVLRKVPSSTRKEVKAAVT